jgi:hypothetical protein
VAYPKWIARPKTTATNSKIQYANPRLIDDPPQAYHGTTAVAALVTGVEPFVFVAVTRQLIANVLSAVTVVYVLFVEPAIGVPERSH